MATENHRRSLAKAFSWRITAFITTFIISYLVIGEADIAITIGVFEFVTKMGIYYLHERAWLRIKFGIVDPPDYQI